MICQKCKQENNDDSKFCQNCGAEIEGQERNAASNHHADESIICEIRNIKHAGVASITYWTILFTEKAVYFLDMGSNYLPLGYGLIADICKTLESKMSNKNLESQINSAKKSYIIPKKDVDSIIIKKGILKGKILFSQNNKKNGISLNNKRIKKFIDHINILKSTK